MILRSAIISISVLAVVALSGNYILGSTMARDPAPLETHGVQEPTLALAPLSLGNPSAALGPEISSGFRPSYLKPSFSALKRVVEQPFIVRRGDTLATVLDRAGVKNKHSYPAVQAFSKKYNPRLIQAGQKIWISYAIRTRDIINNDKFSGTFIGFRYKPTFDQEIKVIRKLGKPFQVDIINLPLTAKLSRAEGTIQSNLYMAGKKAGLTSASLAELIRAFSWDVDFQREIRNGDKFETLFNLVFSENGKIVKSDKLLFAALTLQGRRKAIYRFDDKRGNFEYFDEKGNSAQKALMRTPIDGARLSSGFGHRRHPILGYTRMHRGVDFAAPRGTPIYAAGKGTIELAQRQGAYGKYVRIRHNDIYKTAYAHMSRYGRGIRRGIRVRQGQIIGYVGTTGRSTGNHLHYEILRNGRKVNPMRIKMPSGRKLLGKDLARFHQHRKFLNSSYVSLPITGAIRISAADQTGLEINN